MPRVAKVWGTIVLLVVVMVLVGCGRVLEAADEGHQTTKTSVSTMVVTESSTTLPAATANATSSAPSVDEAAALTPVTTDVAVVGGW